MDRIDQLEAAVAKLELRNKKVEAEKAWEVSLVRRGSILIVTYIVATAVLFVLGASDPWLQSLIPTIGYFLSTLSLGIVKKWWMRA